MDDSDIKPALYPASTVETDLKPTAQVGRDHIELRPHASYEGAHRWDPLAEWTAEEEARVVRKTDFFLLSFLMLMFFGLQLDRGNIGNALTDNLLPDLGLNQNDYNNGTTVQLICFLLAEFPMQIIIKRYGFKQILPLMMMGWGTVSWGQAFMTNKTGFYITRALIGAFEGGFIPGTILFASYFYKSAELSVRLAAFWSTLNVARVISALLAAGILEMRGVHGRPGWFWLFLLEGLLTFVIGLVGYFYLPYSPTRTKGALWRKGWFNEREEIILVNRILRDDPAKGLTAIQEPATMRDIINTWKDSSTWGLYLVGLVAYIPAAPISGYLSLTLKRLGFSTFNSNMLTIPAAVLQIILMLGLAYSSNHFLERTWHCIFGEFFIMPLLIALIALPAGGYNWGRFSISTLISGYPYFHPIVVAWISENTFDVKKRAISAATYNVIVQVGSVVSSQIYRKDDAPYYYRANKVLVAICALSLITFVAQREYLRHLNRRKEREWSAMTKEEQLAYVSDQAEREKDGNKRLDFRFQY
ncbi:putative MFS transporter [Aureobasidium sp. EXF-8845]|nr:putative MFS transporter [Aureobasidium sp. EXF-8846]KAI4805001.1 putative MFS transporter [Aureobasidium sp. EXF-8845]